MEGLSRTTRYEPPSHLTFKIESFSTLLSSSLERYESCEFDAGGYKWKLALYPNGNKDRGIEDHISLYLVLVDNNVLNKDIPVNFTLFLFDHIRNMYLSVLDLCRFHEMKKESGFDKFVSLESFKDDSSGYLDCDACVFGAEVFCIKNEPKRHCLSMAFPRPAPFKYTWKIENFSKLEKEYYRSETFTTRGHDFKLCLYPKGDEEEKGNSISMYFELADSASVLLAGKNVVVEYKLRIVDQVGLNHKEFETTYFFNSSVKNWGWPVFLSLSELSGYLVNDTCVVEAEVIVLGCSDGVKIPPKRRRDEQ